MTVRVLYRSYGGENDKDRPPWYSKELALLSFLRALQHAGDAVTVQFLNDGPVGAALVAAMRAHGAVLPVRGGSNRRTFRLALRHALSAPWPGSDLVWFAEDDYLYAGPALRLLADRVAAGPADYVGLYGTPARGDGSRPWSRGESTTSTFGVRLQVLRRDQWVHRVAPVSGGDWDRTSCLAYQGVRPFPVRRLLTDLVRSEDLLARRVVKGTGKAAGRVALDLLATRAARRPSTLVVAQPCLVTHLEQAELADGRDWEREAADVLDWADRQPDVLAALAGRGRRRAGRA